MLGVRARHLLQGLQSRLRLPLTSRGPNSKPGRPPDVPPQTKKKVTKTTKMIPPTSPHKLNQVAVFDTVAEVADVHAVLTLAVLRKLDRLLVRRVDGTAERTWERL
jgi:hypothetical protein